jgi:membrane associated rhomboid family serine protease
MNSSSFQFSTPKVIRHLVRWISLVSIFAASIDALFHMHLVSLLSLTENSYKHLFLWQPFTSLFLIPAHALSFGFLLDIAFAMLLLWLLGTLLVERIGTRKFLFSYASCGIISGLVGLFASFSGWQIGLCLPAILGVCTLWTMSDPYQKLILFFVFPIQAKWILAFALIGTLFNAISVSDITAFFTFAAAFIWSWLYGIIVLRFSSPFEWMHKPEEVVRKTAASLRAFWDWRICSIFRKSRKR